MNTVTVKIWMYLFILVILSLGQLSSFLTRCKMPHNVSIRIVDDFGLQTYQVTRKLKRATTVELTTKPAIIFIHC
jgi:hypothetical protein